MKIEELNFTAINLQVANWHRSSACRIALVRVENGEIADEFFSLIKPEPYFFDLENEQINGVTQEMCKTAPSLEEIWRKIAPFIINQVIIGFGANLEKSVLKHIMNRLRIAGNIKEYLCAEYVLRVNYPDQKPITIEGLYEGLFDEKLDSENIVLDKVKAISKMAIKVVKAWDPPSFLGMIRALYDQPHEKRNSKGDDISLASLMPDVGFEDLSRFRGKQFVFSGTFNEFTKEEAGQYIVNNGGKANNNITKSTTHVVRGEKSDLGMALEAVEVLDEQEFLKLVN